jgi:divalent metal cation (Fe/Co/Zn/Cd) transporter
MGVLVSVVVVKQAYVTGRDSFRDLSDAPTSREETLRLRDTCLTVPGILSVHSILARRSGPYIFVECTVGVEGMISASAAHRIAELVRIALLQNHPGRVANAVIHILPIGSAGMGDAHPHAARKFLAVRFLSLMTNY